LEIIQALQNTLQTSKTTRQF